MLSVPVPVLWHGARLIARRWRVLGGVTLVCALLAGCTATATSSTSSTATTPSSRPSHADAPGKIAAVSRASDGGSVESGDISIVLPTHIPNNAALRKHVRITSCRATESGWTVKGTADNPGKTSATYHLMVFFSTTSARTLASVETDVTVPAGKTSDWTMTKKFAGEKKMNCTLVGVA